MAGVTNTEDDRGAEGVEHLQAAARELLLAARSFLNVVEEVVEDRDRLAGAAAGVTDLLRDTLSGTLGSSARLEPWERAAWQTTSPTSPTPAGDDSDLAADDTRSGDTAERAGVASDTASDTAAAEGDADRNAASSDESSPAGEVPQRRGAGSARNPPRRVRRISVD